MEQKTKAWGVTSVIIGTVSIFTFFAPYFGLVLGIAAIVFARIQMKIEYMPVATYGMILGILGTIINITMFLFLLTARLIG